MMAGEARVLLDAFNISAASKNKDRRWIRMLLERAAGGESLNTMQITMLRAGLGN